MCKLAFLWCSFSSTKNAHNLSHTRGFTNQSKHGPNDGRPNDGRPIDCHKSHSCLTCWTTAVLYSRIIMLVTISIRRHFMPLMVSFYIFYLYSALMKSSCQQAYEVECEQLLTFDVMTFGLCDVIKQDGLFTFTVAMQAVMFACVSLLQRVNQCCNYWRLFSKYILLWALTIKQCVCLLLIYIYIYILKSVALQLQNIENSNQKSLEECYQNEEFKWALKVS